MNTAKSSKNIYIAMLLCIFFGIFGLHNFYIGQKIRGLVKIIILIIALLLFIMCYASAYDINLNNSAVSEIRIKTSYKLFLYCEIYAIIWIIWELVLILIQKFKDNKNLYLKY